MHGRSRSVGGGRVRFVTSNRPCLGVSVDCHTGAHPLCRAYPPTRARTNRRPTRLQRLLVDHTRLQRSDETAVGVLEIAKSVEQVIVNGARILPPFRQVASKPYRGQDSRAADSNPLQPPLETAPLLVAWLRDEVSLEGGRGRLIRSE
jgi:hypothetical protein